MKRIGLLTHLALSVSMLAGFATACSAASEEARPIPPPTATVEGTSTVPVSSCECGTAPGCPPCPATSASPVASAPLAPAAQGTFPPAPFKPPVERNAKPGDGEWKSLDVHRGAGSASPLWRSIVHPHKIRGFVVVELVAIDTTRVSMDLILGPEEPEGSSFPAAKRTGLVPAAAQPNLIAVTNGGFKKRHGGHGVSLAGETVVPAQREACTFAKTKDGSYRIGTYSAIEGVLEGHRWFRQTAPCLIENGVKNPDLENEYKAKKWGGAEDGNKEIRRSAIGFGKDQRTLYFAIGDYVTAEWLADGLLAAGLTVAAQLDINYSYTRFITYAHSGSDLIASSPLLSDLKAPKKEYWKTASPRDFFSLTWLESEKP
jgi:hypothetical protein